MGIIRAKQKDQDYEPIIFEVEGEKFKLPDKIDSKLMERVYELDKDILMQPAHETIQNNLKQLAIFANKEEDYFVKKEIDLRDARSICEQIMEAFVKRDTKKKKKKSSKR